MQIPLHFNPRSYQIPALEALNRGVEIAVLCWSRRAGKDMTSFAYAVKRMVEEPMNVVLVFPVKDQGKDAFWENVENDGWKTIDRIPKSLIARMDNTEMRLTLKNGSTFQILGATDPKSLRGANGRIYIFSEFVDIPSSALDIIRPIVVANGGQIIMISTPKIDGVSGASFKKYFDMASKNPNWFASRITADQYLKPEVLEALRQESIEKWGNDFFFRQEYLCDWGQVSSSSYFGAALALAKKRGRIGMHPYNPVYQVYTAIDLGMSDSTAITFFQYYGKKLYVIDYFETSDIGYSAIVAYINAKHYNYGWHFFPHDGTVRDSDAVQRIRKYQEAGLINSSVLRREPKDLGISRAVEAIPDTFWNDSTTKEQRKKLLLYKRKFNEHTGDYMGPEHKTESHASDSVRYMYKAVDEFFDKITGEFVFSPANSQDSYESEEIGLPDQFQYA